MCEDQHETLFSLKFKLMTSSINRRWWGIHEPSVAMLSQGGRGHSPYPGLENLGRGPIF